MLSGAGHGGRGALHRRTAPCGGPVGPRVEGRRQDLHGRGRLLRDARLIALVTMTYLYLEAI